MQDKIRYTLKSESTGLHFTFSDTPALLAREIKRMIEFNFVLIGVEGVDGFTCPPPENEFAHDAEGNLV